MMRTAACGNNEESGGEDVRKLKLMLIGTCLFFAGCSTVVVPTVYTPGSTMTVAGEESVGLFTYAPADAGKLKTNQIQNRAMGDLMFDKSVNVFFEDAVFAESRRVGIDVTTEGPLLHGVINAFVADDLGSTVRWSLDVTYIVDNRSGATPCYRDTKRTAAISGKDGDAYSGMTGLMRSNIESLFSDRAFVACITAKRHPSR